MRQNFEAKDISCWNFSSVREEYNGNKGKSFGDLNIGSESMLKRFKLTGVGDGREIYEENHEKIEQNGMPELNVFSMVNSMPINGFDLLAEINSQIVIKMIRLEKKRIPQIKE